MMYRFIRKCSRDPYPEEEELEEIYDDIIGNLMICSDHLPEGIVSTPPSSILNLMDPQLMTSESLINLIRDRLMNQQLSGSSEAMNTIIR